MKKRLEALMAGVCLFFFAGNVITTQAAVNAVGKPCLVCGGGTEQHGQHMGHWYETVNVILPDGSVGKCTEFMSVDRIYNTCPAHGTWYEDHQTVLTHSIIHL